MTTRTVRVAALTALLLAAVAPRALAQQTEPSAEPTPAAQKPASSSPWDNITFCAALEAFYEYNWNDPLGRVNLLRAYLRYRVVAGDRACV